MTSERRNDAKPSSLSEGAHRQSRFGYIDLGDFELPVSACELEYALYPDPRVLEVVVLPEPDFAGGILAVVAIDPHDGTSLEPSCNELVEVDPDWPGAPVLKQELTARCRAHLAPRECPIRVALVRVIPHVATGAAHRRVVYEHYAAKL